MQLILHPSAQETTSGDGPNSVEPGLQIRALVVNVSQISVNLLGTVTFKVQHSSDGSTWFDIPNLASTGISATGAVTISISPVFSCMDHIQLVWTFNNANSVTFTAVVTGDK
jgi:hypothetical protein